MQRYLLRLRSGEKIVTWAMSDDRNALDAELDVIRAHARVREARAWIEDRHAGREPRIPEVERH